MESFNLIKKLLNSKSKKDLLFSYFSQISVILLGFLQVILLTKFFGIETYGKYMIIISSAGVFTTLLTAKSTEAVTKFCLRERLKGNISNEKLIILFGLSIDVLIAFTLLAIIYLVSPLIATFFFKRYQFII